MSSRTRKILQMAQSNNYNILGTTEEGDESTSEPEPVDISVYIVTNDGVLIKEGIDANLPSRPIQLSDRQLDPNSTLNFENLENEFVMQNHSQKSTCNHRNKETNFDNEFTAERSLNLIQDEALNINDLENEVNLKEALNCFLSEEDTIVSINADTIRVVENIGDNKENEANNIENESNILEKETDTFETVSDNVEKDPDYQPEGDNAKISEKNEEVLPGRENRTAAQIRRLKGKSYQGYKRNREKVVSRTPREAKKLKQRCGHRAPSKSTKKSFMCSFITEEERQSIFKSFWKLETWNEKKLFVRNHVITRPIRRRRKAVAERETAFKKKEGHDYYLNSNNEKRKVCHKMFTNTLALGEDSLKRWVNEGRTLSGSSEEGELQPKSHQRVHNKGTRQNHSKTQLRDTVVEWLDLVPKVPSHYCRASSSRNYVDNSFISKQNMYRIFKIWCSENSRSATHLKAFKQVLKEQKISIHTPRKDQCDICVGYKCGTVPELEYNAHREKEKAGRAAKADMKSRANDENHIVTMDLQSVLTCPKLLASQSYYKLKMQLHNFTIYSLNDKKVSLYVWHESNGGVTANEFTSCVIDYLWSQVNSNPKIGLFVLISDGCNYQNRNKTLASALSDFAFEKKVTIQQLFLEKGHTMMEADSVHSTLEHYFYPPINSPSDYVARMRMARPHQPYNIKVLDYKFFKSYEQTTNISSIRPGKRVRDPTVTDLRIIKYLPDGKIYYSLDYSENFKELPTKRCNQPMKSYNVQVYKQPIPISDDKFKHLQDLKSVIEADHHPFYDALPHINKKKK